MLVSEGVDAEALGALRDAVAAEGAMLEVVAPVVGGVTASDGSHVDAQQKVDGGPSVLYDAVAVLVADDAAGTLASDATVQEFVSDAHAHRKFVAYTPDAMPILEKVGVAEDRDDGWIDLTTDDAAAFVEACRGLRHWTRGSQVDRT